MRAETKLIQYSTARRLGVNAPETRVVAVRSDLTPLGPEIVMKPLGVAVFRQAGTVHRIPARVVRRAALGRAIAYFGRWEERTRLKQ